jgi:predicted ABC-type ATPase
VNADNIARELVTPPGPTTDLAAGRILFKRLGELEHEKASFALETNLANHTLVARIPRWRMAGYEVSIYFVWLPSPEMSIQRVAARVRSGGHYIPEAVIRRRYVV